MSNFKVKKGTAFHSNIDLKNDDGTAFDLTGYTAKMQIRLHPTTANLIKELTIANGGIVMNASSIDLILTSAQTSVLEIGEYYYDLFLTLITESSCILEGRFEITKNVTII